MFFSSDFQFLYHRLDLIKPSYPCDNFGRYAVKGKHHSEATAQLSQMRA